MDNIHLIEFLLGIVICCHSELDVCYQHGGARGSNNLGKRFLQWNGMWNVQTTVVGIIGEAFIRVGSSLPVELWHSVVEVAAFVATLKMFLGYDLSSSSMLSSHSKGDPGSLNGSSSTETTKKDVGAYRPPHLRRRKSSCSQQRQTQISQASSDHDFSVIMMEH